MVMNNKSGLIAVLFYAMLLISDSVEHFCLPNIPISCLKCLILLLIYNARAVLKVVECHTEQNRLAKYN